MENVLARRALSTAAASIVAAMASHALAQVQATWASPVSGSYTDPSKWSTAPYYPTAGNPTGAKYDATIAGAGPGYTVTLPSAVTLNSLTLGNPPTLAFDGGTLSVVSAFRPGANPVTGTGSILFAASSSNPNVVTIAPAIGVPVATLGPGITLNTNGFTGTLGSATQSVHVQGPVIIDSSGVLSVDGPDWSLADVSVTGYLYLRNTFPTSRLAGIRHNGPGNGLIIIDGTLDNSGATLDLAQLGGSLTWSNTIKGGTITSSSPSATLSPLYAGTVPLLDGVTLDFDWNPRNPPLFRFQNGLALANNHVLSLNYDNGGFALTGSGSVTGSGTVVFNNNTNLNLSGSMKADAMGPGITARTAAVSSATLSSVSLDIPSLQGTVVADIPRFSVTLAGANWVNTGTLVVNRGTLLLGGSFTPSSIGHLVRTGDGSVYINGTLNMPPGDDTLAIDASTGTIGFSGGTVNGGTIRTRDGATAIVSGSPTFQNVTLAGTLNIMTTSTVTTSGLAGLTLDNATVTIATACTLRGPLSGTAQVNFVGTGCVVHPNAPSFTYGPNISFSATTGSATLGAAGQSVTTQGALSVAAPNVLLLAASQFTNAGTITASQGAVLGLNPATFVNQGTLDVAAATVRLTGSFATADYRGLNLPATPLQIAGSDNNANDTLTSSVASPLSLMASSVVTGGTLAAAPAAPVLTTGGATLAGSVTLTGPLVHTGGVLTVSGNLTGGTAASVSLASPSAAVASIAAGPVTTLAGSLDVSFDGAGTDSVTVPSGGTLTIGPSVTFRTGTRGGSIGNSGTVLVNHGTLAAQTAGTTLQISSPNLTNHGTLAASNGGTLFVPNVTAFTNTGTISVGPSSVLRLRSLPSPNSGRIDLAGGTFVLDYISSTPYASLRQQLAAGRAGGDWSGTTGVTSSSAAADPSGSLAVAYVDAAVYFAISGSQTRTIAGQTVDATTALVFLAPAGDANCNGTIDPDDYALLDKGYATHASAWWLGDFNYDGQVTGADYLLIDATAARQAGGLSPELLAEREAQFGSEYVAELVAAVPEPGAAVPIVSVGLSLAGCRRRRCVAVASRRNA